MYSGVSDVSADSSDIEITSKVLTEVEKNRFVGVLTGHNLVKTTDQVS